MRIYRWIILFTSVIILLGCESLSDVGDKSDLMMVEEPVFVCDLPSFPIEVLYVLAKEYESGSLADSVSFDDYLEQRLIYLFPEKAYKGIVGESRSQFDKEIEKYKNYLNQLTDLHGIQINEELSSFKSGEIEEIDIQYTEEEQRYLDKLENYSKNGQMLSKEDLNMITANFGSMKSVPYIATTLSLTVWGSAATIGCIMVCVKRVDMKAEEFYADQLGYGEVGDAFRHIYVGMLLRRYLNQVYAWIIAGSYETLFKNEHARDTYMDYHNNKIGRDSKYRLFRGKWYKHWYDWNWWAENIRDYINDQDENGFFTDWLITDPDKEEAKAQAKEISDEKYIYFR